MIPHLIQSTLFAGLIWCLVILLRHHAAKHRHTLWMIASLKFLVPFSVLVTLGNRIDWKPVVIEQTQPFPRAVLTLGEITSRHVRHSLIPGPQPRVPVLGFMEGIWIIGILITATARIQAVRHAGRQHSLEPGVFGITRPSLRIPQFVIKALPYEQLEAVIAHERCHLERRDNLTGAIHMVVEAVFWFHPLVWWIGARLIEERERACDEAVVSRFGDPETYARAILSVARICVQSPAACISGVTGSNLKRRIERIMKPPAVRPLSIWHKTYLAALGLAILAAPLFVGVGGTVRAQSQKRLTFEVASVRISKAESPRMGSMRFLPGGRFTAEAMPLSFIIAAAYEIPFQSSRLSLARGVELPPLLFDIEAAGPKSEFPRGISAKERNLKLRLMVQALLADRFHLKIHTEAREQPAYALVVARGGPRLQKSAHTVEECDGAEQALFDPQACHSLGGGQGRGIHGTAVSMADIALYVQNWTDKPVVDETGLKDLYAIDTEGWTPMRIRPPNPDGSAPSGGDAGLADPDRQTLFKVFDQLGLRMESKRALVDMYVVEAVERPTEN